jgi:hypothetical protein
MTVLRQEDGGGSCSGRSCVFPVPNIACDARLRVGWWMPCRSSTLLEVVPASSIQYNTMQYGPNTIQYIVQV